MIFLEGFGPNLVELSHTRWIHVVNTGKISMIGVLSLSL